MARIVRRSPVRFWSLALALGITGGLLVALFTLTAPEFLVGRWPLGIAPAEVEQYAAHLDLRRDAPPPANLERFVLNCGSGCPDGFPGPRWTACWFESGDHADSAYIRALPGVQGAVELRFPEARPFREQQRVELVPATEATIRDKYLQVLAEELGLLTPEVSFVQLALCGRELGAFRKASVVDATFLARHGMLDGIAYAQAFDPARPDRHHPSVDAEPLRAGLVHSALARACADLRADRLDEVQERVDRDAAMAWLLMLLVEGEEDPLYRTHAFAYRQSTGRIMPVFTIGNNVPDVSVGGSPPWACNPFTPLLGDAAFQRAMREKRDKLVNERWRIKERFAGIDRTWLPLLGTGGSEALALANAKRMQEELLDRLQQATNDPATLARTVIPAPLDAADLVAGTVVVAQAPAEDRKADALALAKRFRIRVQGDTLVFPRGKYVVNEDLLMPAGYTALLLPGARFEIAAGRSVLVRGSLLVQGTKLNPVFVRPQRDGAHYGTFAVLGNGEDHARISGLRISGGAGAQVEGAQFPAVLALRGMASVVMTGNELDGDPKADLYFQEGGRLQAGNTTLANGRMVLRNVQGTLKECVLVADARRGGKGGLVINGGRTGIDKLSASGISAEAVHVDAAAQVLLRNSSVERSGTALQAMDMASVHVADCRFINNAKVLHLRRVAPSPAGGQVYLYGNTLQGNTQDQDVDEGSRVEQRPALDPALPEAFGF